MLEEAFKLVFPRSRCACLCEWESYAATTLLARMEDQTMEPAPIFFDDLGRFDARPFRSLVDFMLAGLPCTPYSYAGKRLGNIDERSWGESGGGPVNQTIRIIEECRPTVAFFENVPAWVRSGWFRQFGDELSRLGYEIFEPLFITAADVRATHERERVFILAVEHTAIESGTKFELQSDGQARKLDGAGQTVADTQVDHRRAGGRGSQAGTGQARVGRKRSAGGSFEVADTKSGRPGIVTNREGQSGQGRSNSESGSEQVAKSEERRLAELRQSSGSNGESDRSNQTVAITRSKRSQGKSSAGPTSAAIGRGSGTEMEDSNRSISECPERIRPMSRAPEETRTHCESSRSSDNIFAPGPEDPSWREILEHKPYLAPAIESGLHCVVNGMAMVVDQNRVDQLRCIGNGVVALQAAVALRQLVQEAGLI